MPYWKVNLNIVRGIVTSWEHTLHAELEHSSLTITKRITTSLTTHNIFTNTQQVSSSHPTICDKHAVAHKVQLTMPHAYNLDNHDYMFTILFWN